MRKLSPLSPEAQAARRPRPPEELVGALQDRVHIETGRSRPARAVKAKRRTMNNAHLYDDVQTLKEQVEKLAMTVDHLRIEVAEQAENFETLCTLLGGIAAHFPHVGVEAGS